jgi:hypothetical protein
MEEAERQASDASKKKGEMYFPRSTAASVREGLTTLAGGGGDDHTPTSAVRTLPKAGLDN